MIEKILSTNTHDSFNTQIKAVKNLDEIFSSRVIYIKLILFIIHFMTFYVIQTVDTTVFSRYPHPQLWSNPLKMLQFMTFIVAGYLMMLEKRQ